MADTPEDRRLENTVPIITICEQFLKWLAIKEVRLVKYDVQCNHYYSMPDITVEDWAEFLCIDVVDMKEKVPAMYQRLKTQMSMEVESGSKEGARDSSN